MKKHGLLIGIVVLLTAMVFTFAGCSDGSGPGDNDAKSIKITGITGGATEGYVVLIADIESGDPTAMGAGAVTSGTLTADLKKPDESDWTGSGSYYIGLQLGSTMYVYKGSGSTPITYNITDTVTTIAFTQFGEFGD